MISKKQFENLQIIQDEKNYYDNETIQHNMDKISKKRKKINDEIDNQINHNTISLMNKLIKSTNSFKESTFENKKNWNESLKAYLDDPHFNLWDEQQYPKQENIKKKDEKENIEKEIEKENIKEEDQKEQQKNIKEEKKQEEEKKLLIVYCDGSCKRNGTDYAIAGIGIWFANNDKRNYSQRLQGKHTNNTAELIAISKVLDIVEKDIEFEIRSDSLYSVSILTGKWKAKENIQLINEIKNKLKNRKVILTWIARDSERGNTEADKLANKIL